MPDTLSAETSVLPATTTAPPATTTGTTLGVSSETTSAPSGKAEGFVLRPLPYRIAGYVVVGLLFAIAFYSVGAAEGTITVTEAAVAGVSWTALYGAFSDWAYRRKARRSTGSLPRHTGRGQVPARSTTAAHSSRRP